MNTHPCFTSSHPSISDPAPYWWQDRAWRIIHLNFREIDMADLNAEDVVRRLTDLQVNTVILNTAGIVAYYDTRLPFQYKSPYLTGDTLQQLFAACRRAGLRVISRVDFSKVRREIYDQHPEWAYRNQKGEIIDYHGNIHVCFNSEYQQERMLQILEEVMDQLDPDGFFLNMGEYSVAYDYSRGWQGICQCDTCRQKFKERFGRPLPKAENPEDPAYQDYLQFQKETVETYYANIRKTINRRRPDVLFYHMTNTQMLRQEISTSVMRQGPPFIYQASEALKVEKGSWPQKVCGETSVDAIDMCYRYVSVSPHEVSLRMAQSLANGGFVDFYQNGRMDNHPNRTAYPVLAWYCGYHKKHEADYHSRESLARILLVKPPRSFTPDTAAAMEYRGWYRVLCENHFLFDCAEGSALANARWEKYETVILPQITDLSDEAAEALAAFAEGGGTLIATGETSFYTPRHVRREKPALADALGIRTLLQTEEQIVSSYFVLDPPEDYPDLEGADYVYLKGRYIHAEYQPHTKGYLTRIPVHTFAPPEQAWSDERTEDPAYTVTAYGSGRGVYLPWLCAAEYIAHGFDNQELFLKDLLMNGLHIRPAETNAPPMVEITYTRREAAGACYLHLVNASGAYNGSYFAPNLFQNLYVDLPWDEAAPIEVTDLLTDQPASWELQEGVLRLFIPRLEQFAALRIVPDTPPACSHSNG